MTTAQDFQHLAFQGSNRDLPRKKIISDNRSCVSLLPVSTTRSSGYELLVVGQPTLRGISVNDGSFHATFIDSYEIDQEKALRSLSGRFAIALRNTTRRSLVLAVDRFATIPVFFTRNGDDYVFAESTTLLPDSIRAEARISTQAIFNYLYFHMIPAPGCIYKDVSKLPPATFVRLENGKPKFGDYWRPEFEEDCKTPIETQAQQLHATLEATVRDAISGCEGGVGCFLSGGLDSSSVLGYLDKVTDSPARAFTIGFEAKDYDETPFAEAAAEHFNANLHVFRMKPSDLQGAILDIARAYDEPFGNSSALPTLFCARLARAHGVDTLLAGDGGDELFAGNARYAKQNIFELYNKIPTLIRRLFLDRVGSDSSILKKLPISRKLHSYVRQALIPLPDRLESYNYLHRFAVDRIFTGSFLRDVDTEEPHKLLQRRFNDPTDTTILNRLLYLDWKFTLSDNDIRKVTRMCQSAGVHVEFPMLNDDLVEFSTRISSRRKLRGTNLRYFYRIAMRDFLPASVLEKRKHGFGLPFGVWLLQDPELRSFAYDALSRLEEREFFKPDFVADLRNATETQHAAYYGTMIWVMMMLEIWLAEHH